MKYDVIIIGGGPAGMMAAGRAGELGAKVLLVEKNRSLGVKLLLTGHGRCNLTNNILEPRLFAASLGKRGKFLLSALSNFSVAETLNFFHSRGVPTIMENDGKIFPKSSSARDVLEAMFKYVEDFKVEIMTGAAVKEIVKKDNEIVKIILTDNQELIADKYIVATGGRSYPQTGSTGEAYVWLKKLGHNIIAPQPVLVPIEVGESYIKKIEGASLPEVELSLYVDNKKVGSRSGEIIFTGTGLSGPAAINFSRIIAEHVNQSRIIKIDIVPALSFFDLDKKIENETQKEGSKLFKNYLNEYLPPKMILTFLALAKIDPDKKAKDIAREERKVITHLLKEFTLTFKTLGGYDRAVVTRGGADLKEIDPKTMKSKIISNLYLAGEILDLDGPTGGFNLQIAWTTGFTAGEAAGREKE